MDMSIASMRRNLVVSHAQHARSLPARDRHPTPRGYSGDARLQGGTLLSIARCGDAVRVTIDASFAGRVNRPTASHLVVTVVFQNVIDLDAIHPEGMVFSSLLHWSAPAGLGRYEFENWCQPGGDWDPYLAESQLIVVSETYAVYDGIALASV
jgi:hypothetical protein